MTYYIGIDLGGTNIAAALVNASNEILLKKSIKTSMIRGFDGLCEDMAELCQSIVDDSSIEMDAVESVGIGCPGMIDENTGEIIFSNNLDIYHSPLAGRMKTLTGRPTFAANDANAAALGEYVAGSGREAKSMIAITLGTGVGSGIIIDGKICGGFNFSGGELGHMVIDYKGPQCTCGRRGCLETYASATALIQSAKEKMRERQDSYLWTLTKGDEASVTGKLVFDAYNNGDKAAREVIENYIKLLSVGLANVVNALQPEVIAVGGGISHQGQWLMDALQKQVDQQVFGRFGSKQTVIKMASLGNDAGIIGAALLGRSIDDI